MTLALGVVVALLALPAIGGEQSSSGAQRRRSFVPAGWEAGDCPPAYGADTVLCAGTDTGRWKVDRHIPTLSVHAPAGSCAQAEKDLVSRSSTHGLTVSRRSSGRCGSSSAPCTELRFKDSRPTDPVALIAYVVCPAGGPVDLVRYAVSARVIDAFEPLAREQARWRGGQ